ncbi:MAG TPA: response regulator transcription factor [Solimonas sp.]|nr:response regulator transcription factor [Solimonas sp.]
MRVLIVEDHQDIAEGLCDFLRALDHEVVAVADGASACKLALGERFDAIVLDRMLPKLDGIAVCQRLREAGRRTPVLMLTALDSVADKVAGLEAGADDYLAKPFALAELKARLEALHRRATGGSEGVRRLQVADLCFDLDTLQATRAGRPVLLNPTTRKVLELLMREAPRVVTRDRLERAIWGRHVPAEDVLRIHMHALRTSIDKPFKLALLHTVHGVGYRLGEA